MGLKLPTLRKTATPALVDQLIAKADALDTDIVVNKDLANYYADQSVKASQEASRATAHQKAVNKATTILSDAGVTL